MPDDPQQQQPDESTTERRAAVLAHLVAHLGADVEVLTVPSTAGVPLDVRVFAPRPSDAGAGQVLLVTAGVAEHPVDAPAGWDRVEVALAVPPGWPGLDPVDPELLTDPAAGWPLTLLATVADVVLHGSPLAWGHTVGVPDLRQGSGHAPYVGVLVGPPLGQPGDLARVRTEAGDVRILAALPLRAEELDYALAVPNGARSLVERFAATAEGCAVVPSRPPLVAGAPPYAAHVLLSGTPADLGDAVEHATPNWAAMLSEDGAWEGVFEDVHPVRLALGGAVAAARVRDEVEPGSLTEAGEAVLAEHRSVVSVLPETEGDHVPRVLSWARLVMEREDALGVWLPHQRRLLTRRDLAGERGDDALLQGGVHPVVGPDGVTAVRTRGLVDDVVAGEPVLVMRRVRRVA